MRWAREGILEVGNGGEIADGIAWSAGCNGLKFECLG